MNFHILFQTIAELSFVVHFEVSDGKYQDFFLFKGNQSKAHLYRENDVLNLFVHCKNGFSYYKRNNISSNFAFSWPGFIINDTKMNAVNQTDENVFDFTDFEFISPVMEFYDHYTLEPIVNSLGEIKGLNYGYLTLIVIVLIITIKADFKAVVNAMKILLKVENDYVSMENLQMRNTIQDNGKEHG